MNRFFLSKLNFSLFLSKQLSRVKKIINKWRERLFHVQRKMRMLWIERKQNTKIDRNLKICKKMLADFKHSKNKQYESYIVDQILLDPLMREKITKTQGISENLYKEKLQSIIDSLTELKDIQLEEKAPKASVIFDTNDENMTLEDDSKPRSENKEIKSILFRPGNGEKEKPTASNKKNARFYD